MLCRAQNKWPLETSYATPSSSFKTQRSQKKDKDEDEGKKVVEDGVAYDVPSGHLTVHTASTFCQRAPPVKTMHSGENPTFLKRDTVPSEYQLSATEPLPSKQCTVQQISTALDEIALRYASPALLTNYSQHQLSVSKPLPVKTIPKTCSPVKIMENSGEMQSKRSHFLDKGKGKSKQCTAEKQNRKSKQCQRL